MSFDWSLFLLVFAHASIIISYCASAPTSRGSIRCYSCMSSMYEGVFNNGLSSLFIKPSNFTDHCTNPSKTTAKLKLVECKSVCLNMREETEFLSVPFVGFIRGCYDQMLKNGFNQTIVKWYRWLQRDSCNFYNKQEVLQTPYKPAKNVNTLYICTCYSDGCNSSTNLNYNGALQFFRLRTSVVVCIFIYWIIR